MADYTAPIDELLTRLHTDPQTGLTEEAAGRQRETYGENRLSEPKKRTLLRRFFDQLADAMVIILLIAAAVSFAVALIEGSGDYLDAIIILGIVILNAVLGVRQERRAENALDALGRISAPTAKVLRGGKVDHIPSSALVPGDIVLIEAGDHIPADGRLLESAGLTCEESALTGESVPAEKSTEADVAEDAPLGDRRNMVYSGCSVSYGRGRFLVTATGMQTEMGRIAGLLRTEEKPTPLQQRLSRLGKTLGIVALVICALIFGLGLLRKMDPMEMFMTAVSLAVAVIPEGLTTVVTVVLALGVQRMVEKNAIIRRLPAVETLGSASVICSDKTGTLTQNRMTVQQVWAVGEAAADTDTPLSEAHLRTLRFAALCSDGHIEIDEDGKPRAIGDPTETALVAAAAKAGMEKPALEQQFPRVAEVPFDSDRKRMSTIHRMDGRYLLLVKGGFDVMTPLCTGFDRAPAEEANLRMAKQALRVLAVAYKELDALPQDVTPALENDLTFLGLIGMIDPPREESAQAVALCHQAGIKTVMITGDHVATASAIARQLGILEQDEQAITGRELAQMSQPELEQNIDRYRVYARVSPEDKLRIIEAWQANGDVVAMTGDGVNDAPALAAADIGCAMGVTGTDVAKSAADMVLTDDNFSTIVEAVRSGRGITGNITKTVQFLLGSNLGEVFVVFAAMLLGWGSPLLAIHLLLINVVTDALPALALGVEPVEADMMQRRPIPRGQSIFANGLSWIILASGLMIGTLTLAGYYIGENLLLSPLHPPTHAVGMTMAFLVLSLSQLAQAMNCRSRRSLFRIGFAANKKMLWAVLGSAAIVTALCLIPPLEKAFRLVDLSLTHWLVVFALSTAPLVLAELVKAVAALTRRRH